MTSTIPGTHPAETTICACGHAALQHHGVDPADGCMAVVSHRMPQCLCGLTSQSVMRGES